MSFTSNRLARLAQAHGGQNSFRDEVAAALSPVVGRKFSIDTLHVLLRKRLKAADVNSLRRLNGSDNETKLRHIEYCAYHYKVELTRPTTEAIEVLAAVSGEHIVSRTDVALDLATQTPEQAEALCQFLMMHISQAWHGKRRYTSFQNTAYVAAAGAGRNVTVYTKHRPNCRVEVRLCGSASCRRYGVRNISDLPSLDLARIIVRNIRLAKPIWPRIERYIDGMASEMMRDGGVSRADALAELYVEFSHAVQHDYDETNARDFKSSSVQSLMEVFPARLFSRIAADALIKQ